MAIPLPDRQLAAAVAAHRFGLGEAALGALAGDPKGWLLAQIGPADRQSGDRLPGTAEALRRQVAALRAFRDRSRQAPEAMDPSAPASGVEPLLQRTRTDLQARLATAAVTARPFAERLALFWANHFTVSNAKTASRGLVGAFERDAIRPHIGGRFEVLLQAAVKHPAMLRYLDNDQSAGPHSRIVTRLARRAGDAGDERPPRIGGLNENLAREVLELHTLGAEAGRSAVDGDGYTQADVTALARVLTGWRAPVAPLLAAGPQADDAPSPTRFDADWHEPGAKTVLGRHHGEGPQALDEVLAHLARHRLTARFLATKLARHFVADDPPPALVQRLADTYLRHDGELAPVYRELVLAPEAWGDAAKLKTPEEFVVSTARVLGIGAPMFDRAADGGIGLLGQRVQAAPSPAGWPDQAAEWLGPDAVWKRIEWSHRLGQRLGTRLDARAVAAACLGPRWSSASAREVGRAADPAQALTLLLMAPEFQRR